MAARGSTPDGRFLIVGAGGLGCPAALVLARAGVRAIAFIDDDRVAGENLHRQILHRAADVGRRKVESARDALSRIAPAIETIAIAERFTPENALELVARFAVVLDGADNFATKFLINDACVRARVPFVHAGAVRWSGQLLAVRPGAPCYRCLFEAPPPPAPDVSCREAGVVGPVAGVIGALQGEAALALAADPSAPPGETSALVVYDGLAGTLRTVCFRRNPTCAACGGQPMAALDPAAYQAIAC